MGDIIYSNKAGDILNVRAATACVKWVVCLVAVIFASIAAPIPSQAGSLPDPAAGSIDETLHKSQYQPAEIFARLRLRHEWQQSRIHHLSHSRTYRLIDEEGKVIAEETVSVDYEAPHREAITVSSGFGSHFVRKHVFHKFINYELERVRNQEDDWPITSENYDLRFVGYERMENSNCLSVFASPKRAQKDLFQGKIWIEDEDFAIVKIAGHLAKSPSFWIKQVDFERNYIKIGEFWLPRRETAISDVRFFGRKTMTIDYRDYVINGNPEQDAVRDTAGASTHPYRPLSDPGGSAKPSIH
jgi:hypothetical protein